MCETCGCGIAASLNEKQTAEFFTTGVRMPASTKLIERLVELNQRCEVLLKILYSIQEEALMTIEQEAINRKIQDYVQTYDLITHEFVLKPGVFFPEDNIESTPKEGEN